jgi:hypothetical protein
MPTNALRMQQVQLLNISVFDGVTYIALQLTFGGSLNPPTWCLFS